MLTNSKPRFLVACILFILPLFTQAQQGFLISTDNDQKQLLKAYRLVLEKSNDDYRDATTTWDNNLFPAYGEHSIYWITSGGNAGKFVYPGELPEDYMHLAGSSYSNFNFTAQEQTSVQFKKHSRRIAIFKSQYKANDVTLSWEAMYFEQLFSEFLMDDVFYVVNEDSLVNSGLDANTELFIIPAFAARDSNYTFYIDSIFSVTSGLTAKIQAYVAQGGSIYAEGNGVYFMQKAGYLEEGAVNYTSEDYGDGLINVTEATDLGVLNIGFGAAGSELYGSKFPVINSSRINSAATIAGTGNSCIFMLKPGNASGSKIICNTGLPTVYGLSNPDEESMQIGWTMTSILSAFTFDVDATRKVRNELIGAMATGDNAISYDRADTLSVEIRVRNLSGEAISGVTIKENIKEYFSFLDVTSGDSYSETGSQITFTGLSLAPYSERIIIYRVITPNPESEIHEDVENYLDRGTLIAVSKGTISYSQGGFNNSYIKDKDYADILFSARIFADTDVNWKNFLDLEYQPFKVFMIMENKSRSPALNTVYYQYIPKDVPFYWSDQSINIPILKTPGGKFVDVLRGSNEEADPDYDMDSDGHPDVWLDTASIFPKGYTITEEEVYWANPWNYLRTGDDDFVFEDIDHDGNIALDNNGDGVVDVEEPGDKIRVWKVTWDIGRVEGYEYHDPYSSYEIWIDPPDLVALAAGVGHAYDSLENYEGMFYPYTENIGSADLGDTTWSHWMERDENGDVLWKQFIHQSINNYEGFTFIDTADANYLPLPTDSVMGTVPQPHREFLAVVSLGGEEIDMTHYTPHNSLYSNINYSTVFDEERVTPIRTVYTYWAPLPNPLQFEYLSNNYQIIDTLGQTVQELPEYGPARLVFDMDASTEYTYYWIRNYGYDVDYNDPSEAIEGTEGEGLGDGVFGYFVYSIPKGMGGYRITLPLNEDGSYNIDSIINIDGNPFSQWIDNPNTLNAVEIWETPFEYQVYIPQLLIPPALDDNNFDGTDDWIDDRGDRFSSTTGFLHDAFMADDGEDWLDYPEEPFQDNIFGQVDSGWYYGAEDNTYGDDYFEDLGKTHIQINANYMGRGREGSVEISKGGVLVCEEIFGGSPWVIFSHVLSGFAKGTDLSVESKVIPERVYYGIDTVYLKHTVADTNEPHNFDVNFDPYHISYGYGETTITTFVGAKDPCSLMDPAISMPAILDPDFDNNTLTLIPNADGSNPDLAGYPRSVQGTFLEVRVEVNNSTSDNWINTTVECPIPSELGTIELSYVAYPRPLVPAYYNSATGDIIPGDQPGTFTTGWRFNQPEGEVLIKMGNTLNLMQPTRRAYFVFLIRINNSLENGIYEIPFTISGSKIHYSGANHGTISYTVPNASFCITDKDERGNISEFQQLVLDHSVLTSLNVALTSNFVPTGRVKWSINDFGRSEFESIPGTLTASADGTIDLSRFTSFPTVDTTQLVILQEGTVDSYFTDAEIMPLSNGQVLSYTNAMGDQEICSDHLMVKPVGPRIKIKNSVYSINGVLVTDTIVYEPEEDLYVVTKLTAKNTGSDISSQTLVNIYPGDYYEVVTDSLDANCSFSDGLLAVDFGDIIPGEMKDQLLPFLLRPDELPVGIDIRTLIEQSEIDYEGTLVDVAFNFMDTNRLMLDLFDFEATSISFNDLGNGQVQVTATAGNRGIDGENVWFRIYPIIGGGVYEFPIAEIRVDNFNPGQTIELSGFYTLPVTDETIEFIAIIDDGYDYVEITEVNNIIRIGFVPDAIDDTEIQDNSLTIYPLPFSDDVNFKYFLNEEYRDITLKVYDLEGRLWVELNDWPSDNGMNSVQWRNTDMPDGNYIYWITGKETSGSETLIFTGQLTKLVQ